MSIDDDLAGLPDDPILAFIVFESRLRERLGITNEAEEQEQVEYVTSLHAFIREYELDFPLVSQPPAASSAEFYDYFIDFCAAVSEYAVRYRLRTRKGAIAGIITQIRLTDDYRAEVHKHIQSIRKVLNVAEITEKKRDAIFAKLNALAVEVDRSVTRLEAFTSTFLDVTYAVGQGAKNLEPVVQKLERIAAIFGRAKAESEGEALPPPEDLKKLPGPGEELPED